MARPISVLQADGLITWWPLSTYAKAKWRNPPMAWEKCAQIAANAKWPP